MHPDLKGIIRSRHVSKTTRTSTRADSVQSSGISSTTAADGIFACGGQGEGVTSLRREKPLLDILPRNSEGPRSVLMGTGAVSTRATIDMTRRAKDAGADAVTIINLTISPDAG
jgi:cyanophycinase-like exopeptidase